MNNKKCIIVSGINFFEGGPLTIIKEVLSYCNSYLAEDFKIIALVYKKELFEFSKIEYIEFPKSRGFYLYRLYFEYIYFRKISKIFNPFLWLSLHDITPNVKAQRKAVYCHNPSPFYNTKLKDWYFSYKLVLFAFFYKFLYRINIKKNDYVIVQQNWLAKEFLQTYKLNYESIIVAYPLTNKNLEQEINKIKSKKGNTYRFFFPSFPRPFKNFEIICAAVEILNKKMSDKFEVILTIDGTENNYSRWILNKYGKLPNVRFIGLISKSEVFNYYNKVNCLIFPSRLETWGLPISEFSAFNKPILAADLPYAYETSSNCRKISFFNVANPIELSKKMELLIKGDSSFLISGRRTEIKFGHTKSWKELFEILLY